MLCPPGFVCGPYPGCPDVNKVATPSSNAPNDRGLTLALPLLITATSVLPSDTGMNRQKRCSRHAVVQTGPTTRRREREPAGSLSSSSPTCRRYPRICDRVSSSRDTVSPSLVSKRCDPPILVWSPTLPMAPSSPAQFGSPVSTVEDGSPRFALSDSDPLEVVAGLLYVVEYDRTGVRY